MAASSGSSSGSVVDLGTELDDATSKLFFRAAGPVLSWPASSEIESTMKSQESLVALCSTHGVPSELTPVCAHHLGLTASTPPPVGSNKLCVYTAALATGLRFPLHEFYARVLRHYHLAPSQLTPNSWSYLAAFVLLCKDAGVPPMVSAFRYFFTICAHQHQGKPTGWHHFRPYFDGTRRLFAGALPCRSGWKSRFFYLDGPSGWNWNCQVRWGKPKKEDARRVQLTDSVIEKLKDMVKKDDGVVEYIDIKVFLANHREMPVGGPDALAQLKSAVKAEAGAVAAAVGAAAETESASTRKRSRLSAAAAVLSQSPPLQPTCAPAGFAPVRPSSTGGRSGHVLPPGLPPIRASSTGGHNEHTPTPGLPPIRASSTGGSSGHVPPPTSALWELRGMRARAQDVTPPEPQTMCASDMLQLWEARTKASEQAAMITKLNRDLQMVKTWNTQWQKELKDAGDKHAAEIAELIARLRAANDRNNHLNEELARLGKEYAAERDQLIGHLRSASVEVARLQADSIQAAQLHAADKEELAKHLREELMDDAEQLKHEGYIMGARHMRELALNMYRDVINPDELKVEMLPLLDPAYQAQGASPVGGEDH